MKICQLRNGIADRRALHVARYDLHAETVGATLVDERVAGSAADNVHPVVRPPGTPPELRKVFRIAIAEREVGRRQDLAPAEAVRRIGVDRVLDFPRHERRIEEARIVYIERGSRRHIRLRQSREIVPADLPVRFELVLCLELLRDKHSDRVPQKGRAAKGTIFVGKLGMKYLVMEVSSQAYKVERVYGLTFDVATFLNISPDHISPIEHPTFEDYLYCKRQIVRNSRALVLGAASDHADLLRQDAADAGVPVTTFELLDGQSPAGSDAADVTASPANAEHSAYRIAADGADLGEFRLALDGDFNYANAAAALAIAHAAGIDLTADAAATHAMEPVRIAGRMEQFHDPQSNTLAIVDYAHNYASVTALLDFVDERFGSQHPRITLVTGSAGNKAYDRRKEIVEAAQHRIDSFIFTAEDTNTEPFIDICMEMQRYITVPGIASTVISDRPSAVTNAIYDARAHADRFNIILIIGKGDERWIKDHNKHVPFEGDDRIVERMFA